jgi:thioredoxin-like negative regulator of GroEL
MIEAESVRQVEDAALNTTYMLLFFVRNNDATCDYLERRIRRLVRRYPEMEGYRMNLDTMPYGASRYLVYTVPTVLLYYRGKPAVKRVGMVDIQQLRADISQLHERASG